MKRPDMYIEYMPLEEYSEKFKDIFTFKREDGILEVRMHTEGGPVCWNEKIHLGLSQMFSIVGADPENEVIIFGGTGDQWVISRPSPEDLKKNLDRMLNDPKAYAQYLYDDWYNVGNHINYIPLYNIHVPIIGVINGPGPHTEFPLMMDITYATPDATFVEPHFNPLGMATGDGLYLVFQELFGVKRANQMACTGCTVSAQQAYDWGGLNGVFDREEIWDKAWEMARFFKSKDRITRMVQHDIMRQRWREVFSVNAEFQFMAECMAEAARDHKAELARGQNWAEKLTTIKFGSDISEK